MSSKRCLTAALLAALLAGRRPCAASDCNGNGIRDAEDIAFGTSRDCNANGVPDDCDVRLFAPDGPPPSNLLAGERVVRFAAADLNADGRADLAVLSWTGAQRGFATTFVSGGPPGLWYFTDRQEAGRSALWVLPADLENDGDADLLVGYIGDRDSRIEALVNSGNAEFTTGSTLTAAATVFRAQPADFDRDGDADLIVLEKHGAEAALQAHENDGQGGFSPRRRCRRRRTPWSWHPPTSTGTATGT